MAVIGRLADSNRPNSNSGLRAKLIMGTCLAAIFAAKLVNCPIRHSVVRVRSLLPGAPAGRPAGWRGGRALAIYRFTHFAATAAAGATRRGFAVLGHQPSSTCVIGRR